MCGIFGCVGVKNPVKAAIAGLKRLEYRGYGLPVLQTLKKEKLSL